MCSQVLAIARGVEELFEPTADQYLERLVAGCQGEADIRSLYSCFQHSTTDVSAGRVENAAQDVSVEGDKKACVRAAASRIEVLLRFKQADFQVGCGAAGSQVGTSRLTPKRLLTGLRARGALPALDGRGNPCC